MVVPKVASRMYVVGLMDRLEHFSLGREGKQMMFRNKDQIDGHKQSGGKKVPNQPILAAKRRLQLHPFFFRMGPLTLCICSVLLIGLMAILYLSQLSQAVTANQEIQQLHRQQEILQRENQELLYTIAQEKSPTYIAEQATSLGLKPADPKTVTILVVPHLLPIQIGQSK
jgi:cell division protein FtsL